MSLIKDRWFRTVKISGVGAVILALLFLLPGCGSDSTPGNVKKAKIAKSAGAKNMQTITPLISDKSGTGNQFPPNSEITAGFGPTPEQIETARKAVSEWDKRVQNDPASIQIIPGLNLKQINEKLEAERAKKPDLNQEVLPGITRGNAKAKLMQAPSLKPTDEIVPGLTREQVAATMREARHNPSSQVEVTPGTQK